MNRQRTDMLISVIAHEQHENWSMQWRARVRPPVGWDLRPLSTNLPSATAHAEVDNLAALGPADLVTLAASVAVVVLVDEYSFAWASALVRELKGGGAPTVIVVRGLKASDMHELLALGVKDFITWDSRRDEQLLRLRRLVHGVGRPGPAPLAATAPAALPQHPKLVGLIGSSPAFVDQLERIQKFAACDAGVLILGETGTGKELFAQAIHYLSARAGHPCVAVNCGALPPDLVEAELFGHARGAFTSAHESRVGLVAQAQGGTLFLDEVDSLTPVAQVKLLRFLQDKSYRSVGGSREQHADVRIVCASNGDLIDHCRTGAFRGDLFYRLNVLTLNLPPLRERGDDLIDLAQLFLVRFARQYERPAVRLGVQALQRLRAHAWPGNVRELEHVIERAVLLAPGNDLQPQDLDLPAQMADPVPEESFHDAKARVVAQFERDYIENALAQCDGNITHAANSALKNRRAFWELMRKHGIGSMKNHHRD